MTLRIAHLGSDEGGVEWDEYVGARTGTVTDLSAWRAVVRDAYGIPAHFLIAMEDSRVVGTLGLYQIRHPVFGHYLATSVFGTDGGLHFDAPEVRDALVAEARRLADRLRAAYLLIRTRDQALEGFRDDTNYNTSVVDLAGGAEAVWKRLPSKTRNQIRRGQKEGFSIARGPEQVGAFQDVFHEHMRDLGSPAHGRRFYQAVLKHLGDRAEFLVVRDGVELVAGALVFHVNGTAANYHTVALRRFNRRCPNYLLYWTMIEEACARGCHHFDMGRSRKDTSNLEFKSNWNPTEVALHYNYYLGMAKQVPNLDPRNPVFRVQIAAWRKLPLFITRRLGPRLISGLA